MLKYNKVNHGIESHNDEPKLRECLYWMKSSHLRVLDMCMYQHQVLTHTYLRNNGIAVETIRTLGEGEAKYFYFRDNQGNLLEAAWSIWDPIDEIKDNFTKSNEGKS